MKTIALIDYGVGNLTSVLRGLRRAGLEPSIAESLAALNDADGILIPGVGHFAATTAITDEWRAALLARVRAGVPLLGICLGMQWLFEGSTEAPGIPGLALAQGLCQSIEIGSQFDELTPDLNSRVKVPHLGWNTLLPTTRPSRLLAGIEPGAFAYFAHSFAAPVEIDAVATTAHGGEFASVIERDNVFGAQFHPELSAETGAAIFANFAKAVGR
jgi:imidazole glycerol-phosphate synthase subunit HisH